MISRSIVPSKVKVFQVYMDYEAGGEIGFQCCEKECEEVCVSLLCGLGMHR